MAKKARGQKAGAYRSVGTTTDGVRILKPKTSSTRFTTKQIRDAIALLEKAAAKPAKEPGALIQKRSAGEYAVKRPGKSKASAILPTQGEAIARGKQLAKGKPVLAKRERKSKAGKRGTYREA